MLDHGGRLNKAAKKYQIPVENWIDLSTGINPEHWPLPSIPAECFTRLPEIDDGLIEAAQQYYQAKNVLPVAGSQAVIQLLPQLREKSRVGVPDVGYAEHAYQWQTEGHDIVFYKMSEIEKIIGNVDVLIVINPNNPTGKFYSRELLLKWHQILQTRQGWLVVDEAFIDCETINSLVGFSQRSGLIVLRSTGKFFGLAGVRSGFVFAEETLLEKMNEILGQWTLSGVSRYITKNALLDKAWHEKTIRSLKQASQMMHDLIVSNTGQYPSGSYLFKTIMHAKAELVYELFAQKGLLVRLLDNKKGVRFGLPESNQWEAVSEIFKQVFLLVDKQEQIETRKTA